MTQKLNRDMKQLLTITQRLALCVARLATKAAPSKGHGKPLKVDLKKARKLYAAGRSVGSIARALGNSYMAIRLALIRCGVFVEGKNSVRTRPASRLTRRPRKAYQPETTQIPSMHGRPAWVIKSVFHRQK